MAMKTSRKLTLARVLVHEQLDTFVLIHGQPSSGPLQPSGSVCQS
jgi:hypothetical protein